MPAIENSHNISITWHYSATSHGKGPVDGTGGATKRYVWNQVRTGRKQVMDAASFAEAASTMQKVCVDYMSVDEIQRRSTDIRQQAVFDAAQPVSGIRQVHCFRYVNGELRTSSLSCTLNVSASTTSSVPALATPAQAPTSPIGTALETENITTPLFHKGAFVTAVYEDCIYVAQVEALGDTHVMFSFMRPKGMAKCNWPSKPDLHPLPPCDILTVVQPPAPLSRSSRFHSLTEGDIQTSNKKYDTWKSNMK